MHQVAHSPAIAAVLADLRLAHTQADPGQRRSFTVARTHALLQLRDIPPPDPWHWTLGLVRAANILSDQATVYVQHRDVGEETQTEILFRVPPRTDPSGQRIVGLASLELRGLLAAALDNPDAQPANAPPHTPLERVRILLATAVNAGLGTAPRVLELCTAGGGVRFERRELTPTGQDPYRESGTEQRCSGQQFRLCLWLPKPSFGRRLATWFSLQPSVTDHLEQLWLRSVVGIARDQSLDTGIALAGQLPAPALQLGEHATWYLGERERAIVGDLWLIRDRVRLVSLARAAAATDQPPELFFGEVCCPSLRLTADHRDVVRDGAFDLLMAWMLDAHAHQFGDDPAEVHWPTELQSVPAASGRTVPIEKFQRRVRRGQDLLFVWPFQRDSVPRDLRARVFCLWPSERQLLHRALPGLHTVPLRALGNKPQFERIDLKNLAGRSLPPQNIPLPSDLSTYTLPGGQAVDIELRAYLHRYPTAVAGTAVLVAHGRRVAHRRDDPQLLDGVTLVGFLVGKGASEADLDIHRLRQATDFLGNLFDRLARAAHEHVEHLLAAAFTTSNPHSIPLVHTREAALHPWTLGLRFVERNDSEAPQASDGSRRATAVGDLRPDQKLRPLGLTWYPTQLLKLEVGSARLHGRGTSFSSQTLADALKHVHTHGGLWSSDPTHTRAATHDVVPWHLHPRGHKILSRLLGRGGLWANNADPHEFLKPLPAARQTHLVRAAGTCAALAERTDELWARRVLLAHLLVASALGRPTYELERLPLLLRYDPRALQPTRLVSLAALTAAATLPPLVPEGAVSRDLPGPVLEVSLGEATFLHAIFDFPLAGQATVVRQAERPKLSRDPVRRRGRTPPALVSMPLADEMAAGGLRIDVELKPSAITLWSGGLHIENLHLQAPLECVGGRLWLTRQGLRHVSSLGQRVRDLARGVVQIALDSQLLYEPGSVEHRAVVAFLGNCYAAAHRGEADLIADLLPERTPTPPRTSYLAHTLNKHPLLRLPRDPRPRMLSLLRQTLLMPIRLETAMLSWTLVRSMEGPDSGGLWTVELGRRNSAISHALALEADPQTVFVTCALILAEVVPELIKADVLPPAMLTTAYYRLAALAFAHL